MPAITGADERSFLAPGQWGHYPNTALDGLMPPGLFYNYWSFITQDWCGGAWTGRYLILSGGGHGDSPVNAVVAFDRQARTVLTLQPMSNPWPPNPWSQDTYPDAMPAASHTAGSLTVIPGSFFRQSCALWSSGNSGVSSWAYGLPTGPWRKLPDILHAGWSVLTEYDPTTDHIYTVTDHSTNIYTDVFDGTAWANKSYIVADWPWSFGTIDVAGRFLYQVSGKAVARMGLDALAPMDWQTATLAGDLSWMDQYFIGPGLVIDSGRLCVFLEHDAKPQALDAFWWASLATWPTLTFTKTPLAGDVPTPGDHGIYGRLRGMESGLVVFAGHTSEDIRCLRLPWDVPVVGALKVQVA